MEIKFSEIIPDPIPEKLIEKSQVWGEDFFLNKPDKVLISAESGKGKTTLINILLGTRNDYSGEVLIDKINIKSFDLNTLSNLRKSKFSVVPQGLMLFDDLSVEDNLKIKNNISNHLSQSEIDDLLARFGVADQKLKKAKFLSYGQKQRIAIIRSLCQKFDFLLLDEPFSHLDDRNKNIIWETIEEYAEKQNAGIIITSLSDDIDADFTHKLSV